MRKIKFRVWNTSLKKYIPDHLVHISPDGRFLFGALYFKPDLYKYSPDILKGENVVEQFTGLKDKNGTEIYEGDIVQTPEHPGKIVYNEKYACFELWRPRSSDCFIALTHQQDIGMGDLEVVGNIHENPELLEEK